MSRRCSPGSFSLPMSWRNSSGIGYGEGESEPITKTTRRKEHSPWRRLHIFDRPRPWGRLPVELLAG